MFEDDLGLLECLTPKRIQLIRRINTSNPSSIRELAFLTDRDVKNVWDDLNKLMELDLIMFEDFGRSKRPMIKKQIVITTIEVSRYE